MTASQTASHGAGQAETAEEAAKTSPHAQRTSATRVAVMRGPTLRLVHMTRAEAHAFIRAHHRHHKPSVGDVFCLGAADGERIVAVASVGRPIARGLCDGQTLEVNRLASDGTRNACSFLYGACWRAARALGWSRLVTYTLPEEGGASLRAAGWRLVGEAGGGSWSCKSRPRVDTAPTQVKLRWEAA